MRLHNLGYPDAQAFDENLIAFQLDRDLEASGTLDDATRRELVDVHGALAKPTSRLEPRRV